MWQNVGWLTRFWDVHGHVCMRFVIREVHVVVGMVGSVEMVLSMSRARTFARLRVSAMKF